MTIKIVTWNINSLRLREGLVRRLIAEEAPDILCIQEVKAPLDKMPLEVFRPLGYPYAVARGQKGYNGVLILSRLPIADAGHRDFCGKGDARHVAARLANGVTIENFYVPAGGDVPDRDTNPKFGHKLDFVAEMRVGFAAAIPSRTILVGDLNIAPREDDVWSHRQLLSVVSHTPVEVEALDAAQAAGGWHDVLRGHAPAGKLYTWWSYRAPDWQAADKGRRLDHVWASADLAASAMASRVLRHARGWDQPSDHAPVVAEFDL